MKKTFLLQNRRLLSCFALFIIALLQAVAGQAQIINTIAGDGTANYSGDGGLATAAELNNPDGVAVDTAGNVYIADYGDARVRKINTAGVINAVAGDGNSGYSGNGGPATAAEMGGPYSVSLDRAGNIYIVDGDNGRIWKEDLSGTINVVAGNGTQGYSGDGGAATDAALQFPGGIAVDTAGNLFIADTYNNVIRKVNTAGVISTIAGNTTGANGYSGDNSQAAAAELYQPLGVAFDNAGNLYIADSKNNVVREINISGVITTVAGSYSAGGNYTGNGGAATAAGLFTPAAVTTDASGNLYIVDQGNNVIRMVNPSGTITTVVGGGSGNSSSTIGDGGVATNAILNFPYAVAVDKAGNIYIADQNNERIREVSAPCNSITAGTIENSGASVFCVSAKDTLTVVGGTQGLYTAYQWQYSYNDTAWTNVGAGLATYPTPVFNSTVYFRNVVTCTISGLSDTTAVDTITVVPGDIITASIAAAPAQYETGEVVTFTATVTFGGSNPSYQWNKNGTPIPTATQNPFITNLVADSDQISVTVYSSDSCASPKSITSSPFVVLVAPLGIASVTANGSNVHLYPNPNTGNFNIEGMVGNGNEAQVEVLNVVGQVVYSATVPVQNGQLSKQITLPGGNANGMYMMRIKTDSGNSVVRFVMER